MHASRYILLENRSSFPRRSNSSGHESSLPKILSVNIADRGGGAERIAWDLFKGYQERGHQSWLAVGDVKTDDPQVMPFHLSPHVDYEKYGRKTAQRRLNDLRRRDRKLGREDFNHPYSKYLLMFFGVLVASVPDAKRMRSKRRWHNSDQLSSLTTSEPTSLRRARAQDAVRQACSLISPLIHISPYLLVDCRPLFLSQRRVSVQFNRGLVA